MKPLHLLGIICCAAFLCACESTDTAGAGGNQEAKRRARIAQEQQSAEQHDEGTRNLWNAQHDILTRDGNAAARYY
jgi:hypothetical protein